MTKPAGCQTYSTHADRETLGCVVCRMPWMKVPACTPCKWSFGVYSGRSSSELWLAACLPTVTVASLCKKVETGESERRSSKSRLTSLQHPRRHRAGRERRRVFLGKQHPSRRSHGQHRGPEDQAGVQRSSQKWRGVVTSLLLSPPPILKPEMCSCCFLLKMSDLHRQYVRAPQRLPLLTSELGPVALL